MRKLLLTGMATGFLVMAAPLARAAGIEAFEQGSGLCGAEPNCFVPDNNWDVAPFTTTTQIGNTVTGSGVYVAPGGISLFSLIDGQSGTASVYLTAADGTTVTAIFSLVFSGVFGLESVAATWESDGGDPGSLGPLPGGAVSVVETGSLQDITGDLAIAAGADIFPAGLTVEVQADLPVPEPASFALLCAGLLGLGAMRRGLRACSNAR